MTTCSLLLSEAAAAMGGMLQGADCRFNGVCTDTRQLQAGQLYVALRGPNFDGHDFMLEAKSKGSAAVLVANEMAVDLPQIIVGDTRLALGELAGAWRSRFDITVIAVTGSNGKTTVKEMIASIFGQAGLVHATRGNLNNEIGVPLTLLGLGSEHSAAVIEEGASHPGDIAYLTQFVRPTVALVTNISGAHLEGFGSVEAVANTKGEIYQYLAPGGTAIINADDAYADLLRSLAANHPVVTFALDNLSSKKAGLKNKAEIHGQWQAGEALQISTPQGELSVMLALQGRHNAMNALAATAAALAGGASLQDIKHGLEAVQAVAGRLQWKQGIKGARILDDTYNANPVSLAAALDVLALCQGERYLALGDMAELGEQAVTFHEQAGLKARESGVGHLYAVGKFTRHTVTAFGDQAYHFPAQDQLITQLKKDLHDSVTLLVKGSRSAHMEKVVAALSVASAEGGDS